MRLDETLERGSCETKTIKNIEVTNLPIKTDKIMKLFNINLFYGMAIVVAHNTDEVIDLINNDEDLLYSFTDMQGNKFSKEDTLKYISEISGYEVNGSVGIISYYKE